ncbi:MAG TPA: M3 family metallopeptidase, partial [Burkholderiales bacterium]|nr:M3 family metallopeptidase [Burkholderiales bacterium]
MGADVLRYRGALAALLMLVSPPVFCRVILPIYDEKSMTSACEVGLESVKRGMVEMEALSPKAGSAAVFSIWNDFEIELEDVVEHAYLTSSVHTDAKTRAAAEACKLQYDKFSTELYQNEKLYRLLAALKPADLIDRQLKRDLLEKFEDGGVSLPSEKRERARQIFQKLELLRQEYERNVQENKARLDFTSEEMKGLPQSYVENAKKNEKGAYLLGFDYPDYLPFMANADDELARKRYYIAFTNRGTAKNLEAMKEIASLRKDLANLYGLPSYSRFATRRLMAKDPQTVRKFLDEVKAAVNVGEARELAEMRELKAKLTGKRIDEVKVNRWDVSYYQEKIRKARFNIDQEALRKYFPVQGA